MTSRQISRCFLMQVQELSVFFHTVLKAALSWKLVLGNENEVSLMLEARGKASVHALFRPFFSDKKPK